MQVQLHERQTIAKETTGQFANEKYLVHKKNRLTASNFGAVIKRRPWTPCHSLVKTCLGQSSFFSEAAEYGIAKESVAINLFQKQYNVEVRPSGLWVDDQYGFLGASPDGLIGDDAVVEVKCLYSCSKSKARNIEEVLSTKKNTCLTITNGQVTLKRRHNYYYQIQGQLNITKRKTCYFIVYINDTIELFVEQIEKDEKLWSDIMLPALVKFYSDCICPEIVLDRIGKGRRCRDPKYILNAIEEKEKKAKSVKKNKINQSQPAVDHSAADTRPTEALVPPESEMLEMWPVPLPCSPSNNRLSVGDRPGTSGCNMLGGDFSIRPVHLTDSDSD